MKSRSILVVSIAFATCALLCPTSILAQTSDQTASDHGMSASADSGDASQMVPAQAILTQAIDAKKMQSGQKFEAKLSDTVHLKNGTELPKGTTLQGTVATDKMGVDGKSTLALRFTQADVKGGKAIPIEATIIGVAPPQYGSAWDEGSAQAPPIPWNGKTLQVDEIGVISGVDLHSRIAGENSAVFVSSKKDNMKFSNQSQLSLAIGARGTNEMSGGE